MGTALTDEQLQTLWRIAGEPVVCFDGDAAGGRAALRAAERALPLLIAGRSLRFVALPKGEDTDSLVRERGPQAMQAALSNARPLVDLIWQAELQGRALDTPERRAALEQALQTRQSSPAGAWSRRARRYRRGSLAPGVCPAGRSDPPASAAARARGSAQRADPANTLP